MLFKRIDNFENYWINLDGIVYNEKYNRYLTPRIDKQTGYNMVTLCKDGKMYTKTIHKILSECFIENSNNYPVIDHVNQVRTDNRLENLRWATIQQNGHNRKDNNEEFYIYIRKNGNFLVQFKF